MIRVNSSLTVLTGGHFGVSIETEFEIEVSDIGPNLHFPLLQ